MRNFNLIKVAIAVAFLALAVSEAKAQQPGKEKQNVRDTATATDAAANYTVSINSLIGTKVRDRDGKELGNIKRIMVDPKSGRIESAIVSVGGGMLGLKEEQVISVPWNDVAIQRNKDGMFISLEREVMEKVREQKTAQEKRATEKVDNEKAVSESSKNQQAGDTATSPKQPYDEDTVRKAQQALKQKGFDPGPVNGVMGDETQQAIKEFQKANGLSATGILDEKTKKELGFEETAASPNPTKTSGPDTSAGKK